MKDWIPVADSFTTLNGNRYSEEALKQMAEKLKGSFVFSDTSLSLDSIVGRVIDSEFKNGYVCVRVEGRITKRFLTPFTVGLCYFGGKETRVTQIVEARLLESDDSAIHCHQ